MEPLDTQQTLLRAETLQWNCRLCALSVGSVSRQACRYLTTYRDGAGAAKRCTDTTRTVIHRRLRLALFRQKQTQPSASAFQAPGGLSLFYCALPLDLRVALRCCEEVRCLGNIARHLRPRCAHEHRPGLDNSPQRFFDVECFGGFNVMFVCWGEGGCFIAEWQRLYPKCSAGKLCLILHSCFLFFMAFRIP